MCVCVRNIFAHNREFCEYIQRTHQVVANVVWLRCSPLIKYHVLLYTHTHAQLIRIRECRAMFWIARARAFDRSAEVQWVANVMGQARLIIKVRLSHELKYVRRSQVTINANGHVGTRFGQFLDAGSGILVSNRCSERKRRCSFWDGANLKPIRSS